MDILTTHLTQALHRAHLRRLRSASRLRAEIGAESFPVLRIWDGGFAIDGARAVRFRGLVDLYDGPTLVRHCLVVATATEDGELLCEYKSVTLGGMAPPADYALDRPAPAGLLENRG